jgi:hypothetical protein
LPAHARQQLARDALAGRPVAELAAEHDVSRQFVYRQLRHAQGALVQAFAPPAGPADVLFWLPVTRPWLEQLVLALTLVCHSSLRGATELLRDLFDYPLSVGTAHNILRRAVAQAHGHNDRQDLAGVRVGAHDEIFQAGRPVLVGADVRSTYCYLLSPERRRDADTWGGRLRALAGRGFRPEATVADGGPALRAGQELVLPGVPCHGDVFHLFHYELGPLRRYLDNRAYEAIAVRDRLERRQAEARRRRGRAEAGLAQRLRHARPAEARAVALADAVAVLVGWLRQDVLALARPDLATRRELYDFIVAELGARAPQCPHRLGPVVKLLRRQRDDLLAFAAALDRELAAVAATARVPVALAREVLGLQALDRRDPRRWRRAAAVRQRLGRRHHALSVAVARLPGRVVRASSAAENLNSRLRGYFFLRRQLGPEYLALLQFFLNHRRFARSADPERVGKSPAELLTGQGQPHWLELLGYTRFART